MRNTLETNFGRIHIDCVCNNCCEQKKRNLQVRFLRAPR